MKKQREVLTETICPACDGTGAQMVKQPEQPGRKIYPAKCKECLGKGRITRPWGISGRDWCDGWRIRLPCAKSQNPTGWAS